MDHDIIKIIFSYTPEINVFREYLGKFSDGKVIINIDPLKRIMNIQCLINSDSTLINFRDIKLNNLECKNNLNSKIVVNSSDLYKSLSYPCLYNEHNNKRIILTMNNDKFLHINVINIYQPKSLFEMAFHASFKKYCQYKIHNTMHKIFGMIPIRTMDIKYNLFKPVLPYLNDIIEIPQ